MSTRHFRICATSAFIATCLFAAWGGIDSASFSKLLAGLALTLFWLAYLDLTDEKIYANTLMSHGRIYRARRLLSRIVYKLTGRCTTCKGNTCLSGHPAEERPCDVCCARQWSQI